MALKPATDFTVDADYTYMAVQTQPKRDGLGTDAPQKTSPEGLPLWTVDLIRNDSDGQTALISVTIPARTAPEIVGPAQLKGLRLGQWLSRDRAGQGGLFWQAESIAPASAPRKAE